MLATWALISWILNQAQQTAASGGGTPRAQTWFATIYAQRGSVTAKNIAFFLILVIGGYLSTAAIAAIPGLQEKSTTFQEVGAERLKAQLNETYSLFERYPAEAITADPFAKLSSYIEATKKGAQ